MEQVKIGIIGVGNMGSDHSKRIVNGDVPELKLVAVADRSGCDGRKNHTEHKEMPFFTHVLPQPFESEHRTPPLGADWETLANQDFRTLEKQNSPVPFSSLFLSDTIIAPWNWNRNRILNKNRPASNFGIMMKFRC